MADGFFGKVKMLIGVEEEEPEEEIIYEEPAPVRRPQRPAVSEPRSYGYDLEDRNRTFVQPKMESRESKVLNMQNSMSGLSSVASSTPKRQQQFKMIVTFPKSFDECPRLVDNLRNRKPVILNLESLPTEVARKIFDFLSGATYALDGNVQKVADSIFIFAPENVDITASLEKATMASLGDQSFGR